MNAEIFERWMQQMIREQRGIRELRVRNGKPVIVLDQDGEKFLRQEKNGGKIYMERQEGDSRDVVVTDRDLIKGLMEIFSRHSLYAYEQELGQGFLTIRGGHRIGISGKVVCEAGRVKVIRDISSLNIRIAHEIRGCAEKILPYLLSGQKGQEFPDTLLISPPGAGKTTLLRDLIRELSDGGSWGAGKNVSVVDERSEIGACFGGVPQCDLGMRTDVMDGCPKAEGMLMMLRSMAPEILAVDEAGGEEELRAMRYGMNCGCRILATVHGTDIQDLIRRPAWKEMIEGHFFSRYVILSGIPKPGTVTEILDERLCSVKKTEEFEEKLCAVDEGGKVDERLCSAKKTGEFEEKLCAVDEAGKFDERLCEAKETGRVEARLCEVKKRENSDELENRRLAERSGV